MLKILIKKQFYESFRGYFVDAKKNKARSKGSIIAYFVVFGVLLLFLLGVFFALSATLGNALANTENEWLYFSIMSVMAMFLGIFGSVFNTYSSLYLAKDNELLLSMPIPPSKILVSRIALVFGLSFLYSGLVWLPTMAYYWIVGSVTPLKVVYEILIGLLISFLVTVLTCALGWIVATVSKKIKSKSIIVVLISLLFFGAYYFVCMRMTEFIRLMILNIDKVSRAMQRWGYVLVLIGRGSCGETTAFALFALITIALTAVCIWILSKTFIKIVTSSSKGRVKVKAKDLSSKVLSVKKALFLREVKRYLSSPNYILNSSMGLVFMPLIVVVLLIKRPALLVLLEGMKAGSPDIFAFMPVIVLAISCALIGMNTVSEPSVSYEGKSFWIIRSLPVSSKDIISAKLRFHIVLNAYPMIACILITGILMKFSVVADILLCISAFIYICFTGLMGMILGISHANLIWTDETMLLKQNTTIFIVFVIDGLAPIALAGLGVALRHVFNGYVFLALFIVIMSVIVIVMRKHLYSKSIEIFESI